MSGGEGGYGGFYWKNRWDGIGLVPVKQSCERFIDMYRGTIPRDENGFKPMYNFGK